MLKIHRSDSQWKRLGNNGLHLMKKVEVKILNSDDIPVLEAWHVDGLGFVILYLWYHPATSTQVVVICYQAVWVGRVVKKCV